MPQPESPSIPFVRLPGASVVSSHPSEFGALVGSFLPLVVHGWDQPQRGQPFINHSGCIRLGDVTLLATWGSAIDGEVEQTCEAQLVLPYPAGSNHFRIGPNRFSFRGSPLFIAAARTRIQLHCTACSGIIISFPPDTLLPVAHAIGGPGFDGLALRCALAQTGILHRRADPRRERVQTLLMEAFAFAETAMAISGVVSPMLRLDDLIRRLIVMLLVPDLLGLPEAELPSLQPFVHAPLVEWLLARLDQPISLSDMERQSSYSRRSLQYAFKQRFGCGPMQWFRRQRLAKARALIETSGGGSSITEIAQACGYLSLACFSRDYRSRYGEPPSQLLRRFRDGVLLSGSQRPMRGGPGLPLMEPGHDDSTGP